VLNLVQPQAAGRQCLGFGGQARRDEAGREGGHTQHGRKNRAAGVKCESGETKRGLRDP
jgi:hypothetical protein